MGQRHMTYVVVEGRRNDHDYGCALYHNWNYPSLQIIKTLRFTKYIQDVGIGRHQALNSNGMLKIYENLAERSDEGIIPFYHEEKEYSNEYRIYHEDNNDGWELVYFYCDGDTYKVSIGFMVGSDSGITDGKIVGRYMSANEYADVLDLSHDGLEDIVETNDFKMLSELYDFDLIKCGAEKLESICDNWIESNERIKECVNYV